VCAYMNLMNITADDDYLIPCTCHLDLPEGDPGFQPYADPVWPGDFPGQDMTLTLNIRTDQFASEISWLIREQTDPECHDGDECWNFVTGGTFGWQASNQIVSNNFDIKQDTVYEIILMDLYGDGFYSEAFGQGFFTVTEGSQPGNLNACKDLDQFEACGIIDSEFAEYRTELKRYIVWDSQVGHAYNLTNFDPTTDSFVPSFGYYGYYGYYYYGYGDYESCDTPNCFNPSPTSSPGFPGQFPDEESDSIFINVRTDYFPGETAVTLSMLNDANQFEDIDSFDYNDLGDTYASLISFHVALPTRERIYRIRFEDSVGDGNCCVYGYGWFTVTGPGDTTVLRVDGDDFDASTDRFLWVNSEGIPTQADVLPGGKYGTIPACPYETVWPPQDTGMNVGRALPNFDQKPLRKLPPQDDVPIIVEGLSGFDPITRKIRKTRKDF
jgi:hypothetical protein